MRTTISASGFRIARRKNRLLLLLVQHWCVMNDAKIVLLYEGLRRRMLLSPGVHIGLQFWQIPSRFSTPPCLHVQLTHVVKKLQ